MNAPTEKDRWLTLGVSSSGSLTSKQDGLCQPSIAARLAMMMLGCYRLSEASDPETFVTAVAATLSQYPQDISATVANPTVGLPSKNKWLPSIAEVRDECERLMAPARAEAARQAQRAYTKAILGDPPLKKIAKARFDELNARLGARKDFNGKLKTFTQSPEDLAMEFAARPVRLSEAALQSLSMQRPLKGQN